MCTFGVKIIIMTLSIVEICVGYMDIKTLRQKKTIREMNDLAK